MNTNVQAPKQDKSKCSIMWCFYYFYIILLLINTNDIVNVLLFMIQYNLYLNAQQS